MAYKFQRGKFRASGSIVAEHGLTGSTGVLASNVLSGSSFVDVNPNKLRLGGIAVTSNAAEVNLLDGASPGAVVASKAVIADASKGIAELGILSITGAVDMQSTLNVFGNAALSGNVTLGNAGTDAVTSTAQLTASEGALFSKTAHFADGTDIKGAGDLTIDFTAASTGGSLIKMKDNVASAFDITQGGNSYIKFATTDDSEAITLGQDIIVANGKGLGGAGDWNLAFKAATTGQSGLIMTDNLASAFYIHQGGNNYMRFVTTNSAEKIEVGKALAVTGAVDMQSTLNVKGAANLSGGLDLHAGGIENAGAVNGVSTLGVSGVSSVASIQMDDGSTLGPDSVTDLWTFSAAGDTTQKDGAYDFDIASHDGTNGLKLGGVLVNASAADLNFTNVAAAGTVEASKAVVVDASKNISGFNDVTIAGDLTVNGTTITVSASELNIADKHIRMAYNLSGSDLGGAINSDGGVSLQFGSGSAYGHDNSGSAYAPFELQLYSGSYYSVGTSFMTGSGFELLRSGSYFSSKTGGGVQLAGLKVGQLSASLEIFAGGLVSSSVGFKGDGSRLTNISSDNVDVGDATDDSTYHVVFVADAGDGVALKVDGGNNFSYNPSTDILSLSAINAAGKVQITGAVDLQSTLKVEGQVNMSGAVRLESGNSLSFNGSTNTAKITNQGQNLDINAPAFVVLNTGTGLIASGTVDIESTLNVLGNAALSGNVTLGNASADTITAKGAFDAEDALAVTGAVNMQSTLQVFGATELSGNVTLGATAAYTVTSNAKLIAKSAIVARQKLIVTGAVDMQSTLNVFGNANLSGNVKLGDLSSEVIQVTGGLGIHNAVRYSGLVTKTIDTTLDRSMNYVIFSGSAKLTGTLPAGVKGDWYSVKRHSDMTDGDLLITGSSQKNIDGDPGIVLESPGAAVSLVFDGSQWTVF